jgi:POT family proton-dependent oligopeptide transporter
MNHINKHPKELWILSLTEACERFAFWGIGNLLVLFLIQYYHFPDAKATHIYGIFTGFAAFLPFIGGMLADRWNYQAPILLGALVNALGCFLIATGIHALLYLALFIIACGYGIFTPSIVTVLGYTYRNKPQLREAGFSIYYASINIGVFLALASLGTIAKLFSWNVAFAVAGLVQLLGVIPIAIYLIRHKETYHALKAEQKKGRETKGGLSSVEKSRLFVLAIFCAVSIFFWAAYNQAFSSMEIFAYSFMSKQIGSLSVPTGVFLSSESFFLLLLAPILALSYARLQKKQMDPSPAKKTALSLFFIAGCFMLMMAASSHIPASATSANISSGYLVGSYFLMAIGEMLLAPIGLSYFSKLAPSRYTALAVGVWYVCVGIAFYTGGLLAGLMDKVGGLFNFFAIFVAITLLPAILMFFASKKLTKMSHLDSH